jgi:crossover junction endodeoxyribonuclease RuvC
MTNTIRAPLRILGLDPGLRRTGWGVVAVDGARLAHIAHGVIAPATDAPFAERLLVLFEAICEVIVLHAPDEAAVEETFMNNNAASALKLGHARACALLAPARAGLSVAEYGNSVIKKAVVGTGAAGKDQVGFMIARLLPTAGKTTADAADALAVAIAHAHMRTTRAAYGRVA